MASFSLWPFLIQQPQDLQDISRMQPVSIKSHSSPPKLTVLRFILSIWCSECNSNSPTLHLPSAIRQGAAMGCRGQAGTAGTRQHCCVLAHSPARLSSTQFHADSLTAHTLRTFIRGMFVAPAAQTSHPLLLGLNELHWSFLCPIGQLIYRAKQNPAAAGASSFHLNLLYLHPHTVQQNFKGGIIYSTYLHNVSKLPHLLLSSIQDDWPPQMEILWEPQMTFEEA